MIDNIIAPTFSKKTYVATEAVMPLKKMIIVSMEMPIVHFLFYIFEIHFLPLR